MEIIDIPWPGCYCYATCASLCLIKYGDPQAVNSSLVWESNHAIPEQ